MPARFRMTFHEIVTISTTFPTRAAAEACGRRLVDARLAACVQVDGPIISVYRWRGEIETAEEWRCSCKTTAARQAECVAALVAAHDYETPEVVIGTLTGAPAYAAWVHASVATD